MQCVVRENILDYFPKKSYKEHCWDNWVEVTAARIGGSVTTSAFGILRVIGDAGHVGGQPCAQERQAGAFRSGVHDVYSVLSDGFSDDLSISEAGGREGTHMWHTGDQL